MIVSYGGAAVKDRSRENYEELSHHKVEKYIRSDNATRAEIVKSNE